ncbi:hypothetical protein VC4260B_25570 [Vibrio cholerae 4260B]|nr:putative membrane protein [Vibrio paracholerae HE-09]EGS74227.1 putative membrane protein [Vibrio cholerae BJG-01]EKY32793.1 hypothetical protein OSU_1549 [Vibrio cholerae PS15]ELP48901.1 hypothetical protein VC4260B_25570 [Vibrio cholerae 4260B]EMQ66861.1 putative membrane protein [Vibrio cholerae O1 str. NHCC-008D]EYC48309.1 membrane protein [Vibrio cholerae O1 biovar El Tor str. L-3226]KEA49089.1 membrane protein [Vibrio cholerae O1 biovar El Tor]CSC46726.1 Uncharacterised protein [Vib
MTHFVDILSNCCKATVSLMGILGDLIFTSTNILYFAVFDLPS